MEDPMTRAAPIGGSAIPLSEDRSQENDQTRSPDGGGAQPAASLADQAKQKLTGALDGQKGVAADMVQKLAESVQRSGEQFQGQQDWIASAVGRGASELSTLANTLRDKDLGDLAGEVHAFARRQPALFLGAALVAGFAAARLGKVVVADLSRDDLPTIPEVGDDRH